jgi:uncharacterized protein YbcV (DUF1398 family)
MRKTLPVSLVFLATIMFLSACKTSENSESLIFTDETNEAVQLVSEGNLLLKDVKKIYKENEKKIDTLKEAMNAKDVETVKKLADDFVYKIDDGMTIGEDAFKKIEEASYKNSNPKFQEYLSLKKLSLRKQLDAFEFRRLLARQLRDAFKVTTDSSMLEKVKSELQQKEESFKKLISEAEKLSKEANELAKTKKIE